jgi:hypothetical protein
MCRFRRYTYRRLDVPLHSAYTGSDAAGTLEYTRLLKTMGQIVENIGQLELPPSLSKFLGTQFYPRLSVAFAYVDNLGHIGGQPIQDFIVLGHPPTIPRSLPRHPLFPQILHQTPDAQTFKNHIHAAPTPLPSNSHTATSTIQASWYYPKELAPLASSPSVRLVP